MHSDSKDDEIINLFRSNKDKAFLLLVDSYSTKIWHICKSMVNSQEEAEDLTQEIFTAIYIALPKFKGDSKLSTWIHSIALNKSKEFVRKEMRQKRTGFHTVLEVLDKEGVNTIDAETIEQEEEINVVRNAISQLPENQRLVYSLVKLDELSYKEVEDMTGLTKSSIESLMFRAKTKLKELLSIYYRKNYEE